MNKAHNARITAIFFFFVFLYLILISNLYLIQIKHTDFFKTLAERQYYITITTKPERAEIYDRFGNPLAINKDSISAFIIPSNINDINKLKDFLFTHFK